MKRKKKIKVGDAWHALSTKHDAPMNGGKPSGFKTWHFIIISKLVSEKETLFIAVKAGVEIDAGQLWIFDEWGKITREMPWNDGYSDGFYLTRKIRKKEINCVGEGFWLDDEGYSKYSPVGRWFVERAETV
jgi:hypothetical protein